MAKRARAKRSKSKEEGMVRISTFLRRDQVEAMKKARAETGVLPAEQIRRALDAALASQKGQR